MWPGTESNRRHEDFQSFPGLETICTHWYPCDTIQAVSVVVPASYFPFEPIETNSSDKVLAKSELIARGQRGYRSSRADECRSEFIVRGRIHDLERRLTDHSREHRVRANHAKRWLIIENLNCLVVKEVRHSGREDSDRSNNASSSIHASDYTIFGNLRRTEFRRNRLAHAPAFDAIQKEAAFDRPCNVVRERPLPQSRH
jgi:hypothetical protein